jgi:hypothetical protein
MDPLVAARFIQTYDVDRLKQDLAALDGTPWVPQPSPHLHDGDWVGLSLFSRGGRPETAYGTELTTDPYEPTDALRLTPYFREVLDSLPCPKGACRLLLLPPGAVIKPHRDDGMSLRTGMLRIHLPIVTHPDVVFLLGGHRCDWREGELWYGDFSREHEVQNRSPVTRVHMVLDVTVTDALVRMLPEEFVERQRRVGLTVHRDDRAGAADLDRFACDFAIPPGVVPRFLTGGGDGSIRVDGGRLVLVVDGRVLAALEPRGPKALGVVNMPPGVWFEVEEGPGGRRVSLVLTGMDTVPDRPGLSRVQDGSAIITFPPRAGASA